MLKKILMTLFVLVHGYLFAQSMNIHTKDGGVDTYNLADIDSITFTLPPSNIPTDGLVAYYPFNGNANDESGNGNDGEILGNATADQVLVIGQNNKDRLSLPNTTVDGLKNFTFSAMLKINTIQTIPNYNAGNNLISIASHNDSYGNGFILAYISDSLAWRIVIHNVVYHSSIDTTIKDLNWHHVALIKNNNIIKIYIDGKQLGDEIIISDSIIHADSGGFIIGQEQDYVGGGFDSMQSWAGEVDDFRIYNRVLTDEEIFTIYLTDKKQ